MGLQELRVVDFKSYRGAQTIGPFLNFTAVIGPNGSGKSNLMDAISFVLGIKSSQLRSSQLSELIYKPPPPERSPSSASVTAVYHDSKGVQILFSRSITSAGVSEYRIDGKTVLYAAYSKVLEGQNVLVKARNCLVFQGDIEAIASQSPKDLTRYFEQVSGSLELKAEYDRLLLLQTRASEQSTHNFTKKRGINQELRQFKEQKEEAEEYTRLVRERDSVEVQSVMWELFHVEKEVKELNAEIQASVADKTISAEQSALETALADQKKTHGKILKVQLKLDKKLKDKEAEQAGLNATRIALDQKLSHTQAKAEKTQETEMRLENELKTAKTDYKKLEQECASVERAFATFESDSKRRSELAGTHFDQETQKEYLKIKNDFEKDSVELFETLSHASHQLKVVSTQHARAKGQADMLADKKKSLEYEKTALNGTRVAFNASLDATESSLNTLRTSLSLHETTQRQTANRLDTLTLKHTTLLDQLSLHSSNTQLSATKRKFAEALVGMQRAIPGVYGRVVEVCKPVGKRWEAAVGIVLGKHAESVVVDTEKTAVECIQYMRDQRAGKATFIPLDTITAKQINPALRQIAQSRLAIDLIQFDPVYERAMQFCCGDALVCETDAVAKHVLYERKEQVKCVTIDGTVYYKTGVICGGQSSAAKTRKWDEHEVESILLITRLIVDLRKARDAVCAEIEELMKGKGRQREHEQQTSDLYALETELQRIKDEIVTLDAKVGSIDQELIHLETEIRANAVPLGKLQLDVNNLQNQVQASKTKLDQSQDTHFRVFCRAHSLETIRVYEEEHVSLSNASSEERTVFVTHLAKLKTQLTFDEESLGHLVERRDALQATLKALNASLSELEKKRLDVEKESSAASCDEFKQGLRECIKDLATSTSELSDTKRKLVALTKKQDEKLGEVSAKESRVAERIAEKSALIRKCKLEEIALVFVNGSLEDYSLDASTQSTLSIDYKRLTKQQRESSASSIRDEFVAKLKELAADIGRIAPNMKAGDKVDEVEAKLRETVEEFDEARREAKEAKDQFNRIKDESTAFTKISEKIDEIYKELTRSKVFPLGGTAYLSLEDSFREMELLSGGEKTLAALALILAIHYHTPSPFFILDEVDAALDNQNVARLAAYVKRHASDSFQFVVISLKSGFYEHADALVGVYRDNNEGGSKVLSLRLEGRFD